MHYLIFLLVTFALSELVTGKLQREISFADGGDGQEISNIHEYVYRNKRGILDFWKKSKSVNEQAPKEHFTNQTRGNLKVGLDDEGKKLGLEGRVNIFKTDNHLIRTNGSVATNIIPQPGVGWSPTYNGSLEYILRDKMETKISVQHDSNSGKNVSADLKVNLMEKNKHKLNARGFWDKNIPRDNATHHNYGGGLDYLHSNKFNASVDVKHSGDTGRTDLQLSGTSKSLGGLNVVVGLSKPGPKESFRPSFQIGFGEH